MHSQIIMASKEDQHTHILSQKQRPLEEFIYSQQYLTSIEQVEALMYLRTQQKLRQRKMTAVQVNVGVFNRQHRHQSCPDGRVVNSKQQLLLLSSAPSSGRPAHVTLTPIHSWPRTKPSGMSVASEWSQYNGKTRRVFVELY
jgi:hypothetical protein